MLPLHHEHRQTLLPFAEALLDLALNQGLLVLTIVRQPKWTLPFLAWLNADSLARLQ